MELHDKQFWCMEINSAHQRIRGGLNAPLRDSTSCQHKEFPFELFWDINFWLADPITFLKAPLAPKYTNFEGESLAEKTRVL